MPNSKNSSKKRKIESSRTRNHTKVRVHSSSGNVFKDMGKSDDEATNLLMRSKLMLEIEETIKTKGWTQAHAAKVIGVSQPRIAELFASRIDLFTLDTLIRYLQKLGKEVLLTVLNSDVA
jgi:predicted XRE-type DNA-binding protein